MHALPVVSALHEAGSCVVDWITQEEYVDLIRASKGVRKVMAFPRRKFWTKGLACLRELRQESYDVVLDLQGLLKSAVLARVARGTLRLGPACSREGAHLFYDNRPVRQAGSRGHAVEELLDVVRLLGIEPETPEFNLELPSSSRAEARPHIALAPCSRWATKNWDPLRMAEAGRLIREQLGGTLFILGGRGDSDVAEAMTLHIGEGCVNMAGQTDLPGLAVLLSGMDLLLCVDSGPMHLAAALGVRVCAVFGATDPVRTGPYGEHTKVVTVTDLDCRPCHSRSCARGDLACLERLVPETVAQAALNLFAQPDAV